MKSGSVLYNFIDTKLNFDTNRLSAVCKHDICCTRIQPGVAANNLAKMLLPRLNRFFSEAELSWVMLIAKRSIILFGADVAGDKSA